MIVNVGVNDAGLCGANYECSVNSINFLIDEPVAGSAFVPLTDGDLCIVTSSSVDVIVDLNGTFSGDAPLRFVSSNPVEFSTLAQVSLDGRQFTPRTPVLKYQQHLRLRRQ